MEDQNQKNLMKRILDTLCKKLCNRARKAKIDISPRSRISPIHLELPNYSFYHSPLEADIPDNRFIGRDRVYRRFKSIVTKNKTESGAYLITGYRGMGKSSFVKRLICEIYNPRDEEERSATSSFYVSILPLFFVWMLILFFGIVILNNRVSNTQMIFIDFITPGAFLIYSFAALYEDFRATGYKYDNAKKMSIKTPGISIIRFLLDLRHQNQHLLSKSINKVLARSIVSIELIMLTVCYYILSPTKLSVWWHNNDLILAGLVFGYLCIPAVILYAGCSIIITIVRMFEEVSCKSPNTAMYKLFFRTFQAFKRHEYGYLDVSLGFDSVNEREIYISIIRQLRAKVQKHIVRKRYSIFRLVIVGISIFVSFHTPLVKSLMFQVKKSSVTLKYAPALYDPNNSLEYSGYKCFDQHTAKFRFRLKNEWSSMIETGEAAEANLLNIQHNLDRTIAVQNAVSVRSEGLLTKIWKYLLRLNSNFNIQVGAAVSYYSRILSWHSNEFTFYEQYFMFFYWFWGYLIYFTGTWLYYGIKRRTDKVYLKLKELDLRSFASYTSTKTSDINNPSKISIPFFSGHLTSVRYPVASAKDLETELLYVLKLIHQKAQKGSYPKYLIIIDEVDKIEPHENYTISAIADETRLPEINNSSVSSADVSRKRQQKVFSLLSNLKHFFTTADTQFFFIAGQELFDASLADVADRNYFLGSVFHQVINIESFYSDQSDHQNSNITSMIEMYLSRLLIPEWYQNIQRKKYYKKYSKNHTQVLCPFNVDLSMYRAYLQEYFLSFKVKRNDLNFCQEDQIMLEILLTSLSCSCFLKNRYSKTNKKYVDLSLLDPDNIQEESEIDKVMSKPDYAAFIDKLHSTEAYSRYLSHKATLYKIITQLHAFTVYLAYRSNGAPKKVAALLDDNIYPHNALGCHLKDDDIFGLSSNSLYLSLGFNLQYNTNLINYLVSPLLFSFNSSIRYYGDKLLIGSSFIYDHLFKFHKTGFSMSDLDLMPEFIDINRAPEMRSMISRIIDTLKENHLEEVHSGLYDFTFNRKLVEEINYLSKINDKEAAAFNFTLDESIRMKQYLYSKIEYLRNSNRITDMKNQESSVGQRAGNTNHCTYSTHFLSSQLGDLHYYDDQFIDAALQYKNSIMYIRQLNVKAMDFSQFINYIRTMLKIGLTYERMGNNDKALAYYEEATSAVISYRDLDISSFGLSEVCIERDIQTDDEWKNNISNILTSFSWINDSVRLATLEKLKSLLYEHKLHLLVIPANEADSGRIVCDSQSDIPFAMKGEKVIERTNNFWNLLINTEFTPLKEKALAKSSIFENLQLFCLPLIAKLQVVERAYQGGIVFSDVIRAIKEFHFVEKILRNEEEQFIRLEFYRKLGNVLFFKNSSFFGSQALPDPTSIKDSVDKNNLSMMFNLLLKEQKDLILENQCNHKSNQPHENAGQNPAMLRSSCDSCFIYSYNIHLHLQSEPWKRIEKTELLKSRHKTRKICARTEHVNELFSRIRKVLNSSYKDLNPVIWDTLAMNISFLSDVLCACKSGGKLTIFDGLRYSEQAQNTDKVFGEEEFEEKLQNIYKQTITEPMNLAILGYLLSADISLKTGNYRGESFNYKKIIYLIQWNVSTYNEVIDRLIKHYLIYRSIRSISTSYGSIHRMEIQKIKRKMMEDAYFNTDMIDLGSITLNADIQEYILAYENWKMSCMLKEMVNLLGTKNTKQAIIDSLKHYKATYGINLSLWFKSNHRRSTTHLTHNQVLKMINCSLLDRIVFLVLDKAFHPDIYQILCGHKFEDGYCEKHIRIQLSMKAILDGVFCIHQAINFINVNGITYKTNHSFCANLYYYMWFWCDELRELNIQISNKIDSSDNNEYDFYKELKENIENELKQIFSGDFTHLVSPQYYLSKSEEHYKKAIDTHSQGDYYRQLIGNMHFLHEDFGSDMYHFFAALDRKVLNSDECILRLHKISKLIKKSTIYEAENYANISKH